MVLPRLFLTQGQWYIWTGSDITGTYACTHARLLYDARLSLMLLYEVRGFSFYFYIWYYNYRIHFVFVCSRKWIQEHTFFTYKNIETRKHTRFCTNNLIQ